MTAGRRRAVAAAALAGLALTATTVVEGVTGLPRPDAVAIVGGRVLTESDVGDALERLGASAGDLDARARAVDYLVAQELLVQRALDLGLAGSDPSVRKTLAARMLDAVVGTPGADATDAELREHFERNRDRFTIPARARVRRIRFSGSRPDAGERAREAQRRLASGEAFASVRDALGDSEVVPIPDDWLTPRVLMRYLGGIAAEAVLALAPGEYTEPIASGRAYSIVELIELQPSVQPELAAVEENVRRSFEREAGDRRLRAFLERARAATRVELSAEVGDG